MRVLKAAPKQTENVIKDNGLLQRDYLAKATNGSREGGKNHSVSSMELLAI